MEYGQAIITRITKDDILNRIYSDREYFVELRREWSRGLKLIFMKKTSSADYHFIGSGIIDRTVNTSKLDATEKMLCIKNNYYKKITFVQLTKYNPSINIKHIVPGNLKSFALLHGTQLSLSDVENIECLSRVTIVL